MKWLASEETWCQFRGVKYKDLVLKAEHLRDYIREADFSRAKTLSEYEVRVTLKPSASLYFPTLDNLT